MSAGQDLLRELLRSMIIDRAQVGELLADVGRVLAKTISPAHKARSRPR